MTSTDAAPTASLMNSEEHLPATTDALMEDGMPVPQSSDEEAGNKGPLEGHKENIDAKDTDQVLINFPTTLPIRIEDSVEAIDAFEEAIEKVGELIPDITENRISIAAAKEQRKNITDPDPSNQAKSPKIAANQTASTNSTNSTRAPSIGQTAAQSTLKTTTKRTNAREDVSNVVSGSLAKASRSSPSADISKQRLAATKRVSSVHRAPFQPSKSTKPLTRPTFELPGEAVARKLKAQREERLKRGEEEPVKKPTFKARPIRLSSAPVVKPTLTSKARISMAKQDAGESAASNNRASITRPSVRSGSISIPNSTRRLSTASIPKRDAKVSSNGSNRVTSHPLPKVIKASTQAGELSRAELSALDLAQQRIRGKEIFNRAKVEQDERERAKKEREEAARKARADAAERGRIASREWAEKQRLKKLGGLEVGNASRRGTLTAG